MAGIHKCLLITLFVLILRFTSCEIKIHNFGKVKVEAGLPNDVIESCSFQTTSLSLISHHLKLCG